MADDNIRAADKNVIAYLGERIADRVNMLKESFQFSGSIYLCSKRRGELSDVDISSIISNYKISVELDYLLREHNKLSYDEGKIKIHSGVRKIIGELEKGLIKDLLSAAEG